MVIKLIIVDLIYEAIKFMLNDLIRSIMIYKLTKLCKDVVASPKGGAPN